MIYEFLADGFELVEAMTPLDVLRRAGKDVKTVSITDKKLVTASNGVKVEADLTVSELDASLPEAVILPGGMPGSKNLRESDAVCDLTVDVFKNGGLVAAICAAPYVLGELGLLSGKNATCYPGFEDRLIGATVKEGGVQWDGNVITAAGMGVALEFSYNITVALCGKDCADGIMRSIIAK